MKKVAHVQLLPLLSGVQNVTVNEISFLQREYDFSLICSSKGDLTEKIESLSITCHTEPFLVRDVSPLKDILALYRLYRYFKINKFDIVHTHSSKPGFVGRIAAKLAGVDSVIHTVHGFAFPSTNSKIKRMVFFLMEYIAKFFTDWLIVLHKDDYEISVNKLKYDPGKVLILPNGINTDVFKPIESATTSSDTLKFVMVGRLWKQKNPMLILQALVELEKKGFFIEIDFIGDGDLKQEMKRFLKDVNLSSKVSFLGWRNDVAELLPYYDVYILPSLWEGMPLAIIEAMACGLPCIVSNIAGNIELVQHGYNGFVFESNNHQQLCDVIYNICSNKDFLEPLSVNARNTAVSSYSLSLHCLNLNNIYSK